MSAEQLLNFINKHKYAGRLLQKAVDSGNYDIFKMIYQCSGYIDVKFDHCRKPEILGICVKHYGKKKTNELMKGAISCDNIALCKIVIRDRGYIFTNDDLLLAIQYGAKNMIKIIMTANEKICSGHRESDYMDALVKYTKSSDINILIYIIKAYGVPVILIKDTLKRLVLNSLDTIELFFLDRMTEKFMRSYCNSLPPWNVRKVIRMIKRVPDYMFKNQAIFMTDYDMYKLLTLEQRNQFEKVHPGTKIHMAKASIPTKVTWPGRPMVSYYDIIIKTVDAID